MRKKRLLKRDKLHTPKATMLRLSLMATCSHGESAILSSPMNKEEAGREIMETMRGIKFMSLGMLPDEVRRHWGTKGVRRADVHDIQVCAGPE
jgi:hypothetical protein